VFAVALSSHEKRRLPRASRAGLRDWILVATNVAYFSSNHIFDSVPKFAHHLKLLLRINARTATN
jgi:hypothetical protein